MDKIEKTALKTNAILIPSFIAALFYFAGSKFTYALLSVAILIIAGCIILQWCLQKLNELPIRTQQIIINTPIIAFIVYAILIANDLL